MSSTKSDWRIPAALIALSLVPAIAGTVRLTQPWRPHRWSLLRLDEGDPVVRVLVAREIH